MPDSTWAAYDSLNFVRCSVYNLPNLSRCLRLRGDESGIECLQLSPDTCTSVVRNHVQRDANLLQLEKALCG